MFVLNMPTSSLSSSYMDVGADVIENILQQTSKSKVTFNNQCNLQANSQTNLLLSVSKRARITLLAKGVTKKVMKACVIYVCMHFHSNRSHALVHRQTGRGVCQRHRHHATVSILNA